MDTEQNKDEKLHDDFKMAMAFVAMLVEEDDKENDSQNEVLLTQIEVTLKKQQAQIEKLKIINKELINHLSEIVELL